MFTATGTPTTVQVTTMTSSRESGHMTTEFMATTETATSMDKISELTTDTSSSNPLFTQLTDATTTAANQSEINDEETANPINNKGIENAAGSYVVIIAAVPIGIVLLIAVVLIMSAVVVFVTVSSRRKSKLLNFKRRRSSGHTHIGLGKC